MIEVAAAAARSCTASACPATSSWARATGVWFDPFHDGARLDLAGCAALFAELRARRAASGPSSSCRSVLGRSWPADAREPPAHVRRSATRPRPCGRRGCACAIPGLDAQPSAATSPGCSGRLGQFAEAADELDVLAQHLPGEGGEQAAAAAAAFARTRQLTATVVRWPMAKPMPMFPLGTVLFPHAVLPLHVFEERYRALTETCLRGDGRFGVVLIERGSEVGGGDVRFGVGTVAQHRRGRRARPTAGTCSPPSAPNAFRVQAVARRRPVPASRDRALADEPKRAPTTPARSTRCSALLGRVLAMSVELGAPRRPRSAARSTTTRCTPRSKPRPRRPSVRSTPSACSSSTTRAALRPARGPAHRRGGGPRVPAVGRVTARTLVGMETSRPDDDAQGERDEDLVALEGLEAEFSDLESELARIEQIARGAGRASLLSSATWHASGCGSSPPRATPPAARRPSSTRPRWKTHSRKPRRGLRRRLLGGARAGARLGQRRRARRRRALVIPRR